MGRDKGNRGIKIELSTRYRKMQILENAAALKGNSISIRSEYTKKVMEDRKTLKPFLTEAKRKGLKAKLVHNKLKINDKTYTVEDIMENKRKSPIDNVDEGDNQSNTPKTSVKTSNDLGLAQKTTGAVPKEKKNLPARPKRRRL